MIRIRRIYSIIVPADRDRVKQVKEIFRQNFSEVSDYAEKIPDLLNQPFRHGYRSVLLVSETALGKVMGFSLVLHFPEINGSLLDFLAVRRDIRGGGIGSALYEATREHLRDLGSRGLYMEALPDDPETVRDPARMEDNRKRLRFYEHYGVRPIANTLYETPIGEGPAPHLLFDGLGRRQALRRAECRAAIRVILTCKYGHLTTGEYVKAVVNSVTDDPVRLHPPRYVKVGVEKHDIIPGRLQKAFAMTRCEGHKIHHVKERGYVERPARVDALYEALAAAGLFNDVPFRRYGEEPIRRVHDGDFVQYLKVVCEKLAPERPVYPYVFPIRRPHCRPKELVVRAGYYCIDTFTPLDRNAYRAARAAVGVALTAADELLRGRPVAYALCRPPGHHAERRAFGGFCYFNNAAIAAHRLSREGKVAVLDLDYHHGNGCQDIFWRRDDVLTLSLHGHPNVAYPYFSGFVDEVGEGAGRGYNRNFPLPDQAGDEVYLDALGKALARISRFKPAFLVVPMGFDTMKGDPTGSFALTAKAVESMGRLLAALGLPTLVVQEGGYSLRNLRKGVSAFFRGMAAALAERFR